MPDDPQMKALLDAAVDRVKRVFAGKPGSENWGDGLPHHPDQVSGMSDAAVLALHRRPLELPASALSWAEVEYFFGHAGWTPNPRQTLPAAFRYFAPRLAEAFARPDAPQGFVQLDPFFLFGHLAKVPWRDWPKRESEAISGWLSAWGAAVIGWRSERWAPNGYELISDDPPHRTLEDCFLPLLAVADFAVFEQAFDQLDPLGWVRFIRGVFLCDELAILEIAPNRREPLVRRITAPGIEAQVLGAPCPFGVEPGVWEDTRRHAVCVIERLKGPLRWQDKRCNAG